MVLKKFAYEEYPNDPAKNWELLEFSLHQINLIVGKNSSGKSRTLNVIDGLSILILNPTLTYITGYYSAQFVDDQSNIYTLVIQYEEGKIRKEYLTVNSEVKIDRDDKSGKIFNSQIKDFLSFDLPENQLACSRRDRIQYPYLEKLFDWADTVRHFHFNTPLGKNYFYFPEKTTSNLKPLKLKETDKVIETFYVAEKNFGSTYKKNVIDDFNRIGYSIEDITVTEFPNIRIDSDVITKSPVALEVKEIDRSGTTDQHSMSMGMFRALSIVIFFNYYEVSKIEGCIMIDDIGEGLDFEKSTNLINLLIEKAGRSKVQLLMSSNDKFVMNNTSLEYWQILKRQRQKVRLFNKENSSEKFEDFKYLGINNFDFFRSEFFDNDLSFETN